MKRLLLFAFTLVLVAAVIFYFRIPQKESYSYKTVFRCTNNAAMRLLHDSTQWKNWWAGKQESNLMYSFNHRNYRFQQMTLPGIETRTLAGADSVTAYFQTFPYNVDSAYFEWSYAFAYSSNPVTKIKQHLQLRSLKKDFKQFLTAIKPFFEDEQNTYGMRVETQRVKDSTLISLKKTFDHYPGTEEVYSMVTAVKNYIKTKGGEESNAPMLNIFSALNNTYDVMVGIPTKADVVEEAPFIRKKMILGYILVGNVKGGVATVTAAEKRMAEYAFDHQRTAPAIPFQSLITDRMQEKDTSKWITRIYYPVLY
ncbi:MAG: hypothetical protein ACOVP7_06270 [Lacibacter sp.]